MVNYLDNSNIFANFGAWIGRSCKPSDKGKLTALPHFKFCQHNFKNVSNMLKYEELPKVNSERWLSLEDLPEEEWRDVVGYESFFSISCYGRLKRKERLSFNPHNNSYCRYKEKIMRNQSTEANYQHISVCIGDGKKINLSFHRMVMEAFVPNPLKLPFINHKDENPRNNCVSNLEWCTPKYNSNYGTLSKRLKEDRIRRGRTRKVKLYDYEGNLLKEYETAKDAGRDNGISRALVTQCCDGTIMAASGLHFRFADEKYQKRKMKITKNKYRVYRGKDFLFETNETKELCKKLNINYGNFSRLVRYRAKKNKSIIDYVIYVTTQEGKEYRIINGKIE